jgi:uncharacterized protein with FMN-binding domain
MLAATCACLTSSCITIEITGGPVPAGRLADGVYEGTATGGPVRVVTKVTVQDQRIAHIELVQHRTWRGTEAGKVIPGRIIEKQSTDVDAVSGATVSSRVIMNAVQDAVSKAER